MDPQRAQVSPLVAASVATLLTLSTAATAQDTIKLNGPLTLGGSVQFLDTSPDASRVVYTADQDTNGLVELYSVPSGGGPVTKLNGSVAGGGIPHNFTRSDPFQITADSSRVVYRARGNANSNFDLFSVPLVGGAVTTLNIGDADVGSVAGIRLSPDSSRAVFITFGDTGFDGLYSAPIAGGPVAKLNGPLVAGGEIGTAAISPDSSRVVYTADQDAAGVREIYSVPITGGAATKLNPPLTPGGNVGDVFVGSFEISPDSSRVVYLADQDTDERFELYSVPLSGGPSTKLNGSVLRQGAVLVQISPDSSRVVYKAFQDSDAAIELYSVPLAGGPVTKLNDDMVAGGNVAHARLTPDGSRVVYEADQDLDQAYELYAVPLAGGPVTKLNPPFGPDMTLVTISAAPSPFIVSAEGSRVVYSALHLLGEGSVDVYSVPIAGGAVSMLTDSAATSGFISEFQVSPTGSRVAYVADQDTLGVRELYSVPVAGGASTKLNSPLVENGDVLTSIFSSNGRVVYWADQETDGTLEIYTEGTAQLTASLIDDVSALVSGGTLAQDQADGLIAKLAAAMAAIDDGRTRPACKKLQAFIDQVNALVGSTHLISDLGDALIDAARRIRSELGC